MGKDGVNARAARRAGMAANVSSFNTVFTYDIWQTYVRRGRPDRLVQFRYT